MFKIFFNDTDNYYIIKTVYDILRKIGKF